MNSNCSVVKWSADNVITWKVSASNITQRDLNRYYLLDIFVKHKIADNILLPGWFNEHAHHARSDKISLINEIKGFINTYKPDGRITIFRSLNKFFLWQLNSGYDYGTHEGLDVYIKKLVNDIRTRKITTQIAKQYMSVVNQFLLYNGKIQIKYECEFDVTGRAYREKVTPYTRQEFSEIIRQLYSMNEFLLGFIDEHINNRISGKRNFTIGNVMPVFCSKFRYLNYDVSQEAEVVIKDIVDTYFITSFFIFCYHTWGNAKQLLEIERKDIHLKGEGIDTEYLYKGRAYKYIHLTIGKSEYYTQRSGYNWFLNFVSARDRIINYLVKIEGLNDNDYLFINCCPRLNRSPSPLNANTLTKFCSKSGAWADLREHNKLLPSVTVSRIRKTAEQYTDRILKNGLIITEKAGHNWETYRKNYANGNPTESKENISKALNSLLKQGISTMAFSERLKIANELSIDLRADGENISCLLNGFGCNHNASSSETEIIFLRKQKHLGRNPKVCADYFNCIDCPKCCVIDTVESVWLLLSFKHAILYGKAFYISSKVAKDKYEAVLLKIDLRLSLIDDVVLKKAHLKIQKQGVSEIWRI